VLMAMAYPRRASKSHGRTSASSAPMAWLLGG